MTASLPGCSTLLPEKILHPVAAEAPWRFTYHDGSGNGFRFWKESDAEAAFFAYTPIRPAISSSGLYAGGNAKTGALDEEQVSALWQWAHRLESDASVHVRSRSKGTGAFSLTTPDGVRKYIVKKGPLLRMFHAFLVPFRGD